MRIVVLTLFPSMFAGPLSESILKRAAANKIVSIDIVNFRDFSRDKHKKVDDIPYGGGSGMVLKPEPLFDAVTFWQKKLDKSAKVILLSPQGKIFNQKAAYKLSLGPDLIFICGHYEAVDERIRELLVDEEWSIGDYILTGGEIPAMAMIDSIVRLLPGVLGSEDAHNMESFYDNLLEYPQYTRPRTFQGINVPEVLLSGDHKKIEEFRKKESLKRTAERRPDLLNN